MQVKKGWRSYGMRQHLLRLQSDLPLLALCLSFLQNRIKITVLCAHLVKHVVGGSVKDSCDLIDLICCQ